MDQERRIDIPVPFAESEWREMGFFGGGLRKTASFSPSMSRCYHGNMLHMELQPFNWLAGQKTANMLRPECLKIFLA